MDTPTESRFTPYQSRYTAYLQGLSRHWAYESRVPGRTQEERRMVEDGFRHLDSEQKELDSKQKEAAKST
tara:strand:- start:1339 stop:1548 length:210 start_codon:yes stop_codon:yes gene_type:complete